MQGLSGDGSRASLDDAVLADTGPRAGQKPAFLDRGDGGSANVMGWARMRPTGYRFDGRSLSLANLPTEDSAQPALQSTRSEDGRHRWPPLLPRLQRWINPSAVGHRHRICQLPSAVTPWVFADCQSK